MSKLVKLGEFLENRESFGRESDFEHYVTADAYSTVVSDSGTVAVGDAVGGIVVLTPSDGTVGDNDEAYLKGTTEIYKFANNQPFRFEALVQFTEANTDDANIMVGVANAVAANHLQDNGAGPLASYSGACFYKVDGGTTWNVEVSVGATQVTEALTDTAGGASYQRLRIEFQPITSTVGECRFWIDGVLKKVLSFTYTGATEMQECFGVKNGSTNLEVLNVDYASCRQLRA